MVGTTSKKCKKGSKGLVVVQIKFSVHPNVVDVNNLVLIEIKPLVHPNDATSLGF